MEKEQNNRSKEEPFYVDPARVGRGTIFCVHTEFKGKKSGSFRLIVRNTIDIEGQRYFYLVELPHLVVGANNRSEIVYEIPEEDLSAGQSGVLVFDNAFNLMRPPATVAFSSPK